MKRDEAYQPSVKSKGLPSGVHFRRADPIDREAISRLMAERNPAKALSDIEAATDRELATMANDSRYCLYVTELDGKVVGFCRWYHTAGLPQAKKKYPAPEGWYGMGIIVDSAHRRHGLARFLSQQRQAILRESGATEFYSIVDEANLTSMRMHQVLGFEEIARAPGFLHLTFERGNGVLFRLNLRDPFP